MLQRIHRAPTLPQSHVAPLRSATVSFARPRRCLAASVVLPAALARRSARRRIRGSIRRAEGKGGPGLPDLPALPDLPKLSDLPGAAPLPPKKKMAKKATSKQKATLKKKKAQATVAKVKKERKKAVAKRKKKDKTRGVYVDATEEYQMSAQDLASLRSMISGMKAAQTKALALTLGADLSDPDFRVAADRSATLLSPAWASLVFEALTGGGAEEEGDEKDDTRIIPPTPKYPAHARSSLEQRLSSGRAVWLQRQKAARVAAATPSPQEGGPENDEGAPAASTFDLPLFDVRQHDQLAERAPLESLGTSGSHTGHVVGASLYDGVRVDIGATVDAVVPLNFSSDGVGEDLREAVLRACPLGAKVKVKLEGFDAGNVDKQRFPLVARLVEPKVDVDIPASKPLIVQPGDDLEALQGMRGTSDACTPREEAANRLVDAAVEASAKAGTDASMWGKDQQKLLSKLAGLPARPAPAELLIGEEDGTLRRVPGPAGGEKSKDAKVRKVLANKWADLAAQELDMIRVEVRCRQQFAADLNTVAQDIRRGSRPSVPTSLLGLTVFGEGRRCLLPRMQDGHLQFTARCFVAPVMLAQWEREERKAFEEREWDITAMKDFARIFESSDAVHVRGIRAVEAEQLEQVDAELPGAPGDLNEMLADIEAEVSEAVNSHDALHVA